MSTNDDGEPVMADYAYNQTLDGGGDMVFNVDGNAGGTAAQEQITLRSRWQSNGHGRADARLTGGDLDRQGDRVGVLERPVPRTYYTDNVNFAPTEGAVADCAFGTADLPPAN